MAINRRDFLKFSAGAGLMAAAGATPVEAAPRKGLPPDAVGILYDSTLCIGCKSCMVNCKIANAEPGGALFHKETAGKIPFVHAAGQEPIYDDADRLSDKTLCVIKVHGRDPKADTPGNAVIHREFEVLVYTWTARLKSFDHQLDEVEQEYS